VQVLELPEILSFLESDENTAPATLLEPPKKPVLASEREARSRLEHCRRNVSQLLHSNTSGIPRNT